MKQKIIPFVIGVLVGAIIGVAGCFVYNKVTVGKKGERPENGNRTEMMERGERPNFDGNQIPERKTDGNVVGDTTTESNS